MMASSTKRAASSDSSACMPLVSCSLLLASCICAVIGLSGVWGQANLNIGGIVSGQGDFTLWHFDVSTEVPVLGITGPDMSYRLDETLCNDDLDTSTRVNEVCGHFTTMRAFSFLALFASLAGMSSAVAVAARCSCGLTRAATIITIVSSFTTSVR